MRIDSSSLLTSDVSTKVSSTQDDEKIKSFSDALEKAQEEGDDEELKKVSQQFEAFFINEIFKSMRKSSEWGEGLTEKSHARGMYESMLDEKFSDEIASGKGIGMADLIYKQMSKQYSISSKSEVASGEADTEDDDEQTSVDIKG